MKYDRSQRRRCKNIANGIYDNDTQFEIDEYDSVATRIKAEEDRIRSIYKLTCDYIGTTDGSSEKFLAQFEWNRGLHTFLQTSAFPIYHIDFHEKYDMGYVYGYEGRAPYLDCVETYIWSVIDNKPTLFVYCTSSYKQTLNKPIYTRTYNTVKETGEKYYSDDDKEILYSIRRKIM